MNMNDSDQNCSEESRLWDVTKVVSQSRDVTWEWMCVGLVLVSLNTSNNLMHCFRSRSRQTCESTTWTQRWQWTGAEMNNLTMTISKRSSTQQSFPKSIKQRFVSACAKERERVKHKTYWRLPLTRFVTMEGISDCDKLVSHSSHDTVLPLRSRLRRT